MLNAIKTGGFFMTEQSIYEEIAERTGFGDSNYFCVKFKKMYGISPKQFQLQNTRQ